MGFDVDTDATRKLAAARQGLLGLHDDVDQVRDQRRKWRRYEQSEEYLHAKLHADAWVADFMWPLSPDPSEQEIADGAEVVPEPPTTSVVAHIGANSHSSAYSATRNYIARLAEDYGFFHWNLEFPKVFDRGDGEPGPQGWTGGFDCMIGNPPWERVKLQEKEFFAGRDDEIATASNAAKRNRLIKALATSGSPAERSLHKAFLSARRRAEAVSLMLRTSGVYPLAGRGDVNTYQVFTELFRNLTGPLGQAGIIVPTGIATDATTQHFFRDLVETKSIAMLYDFENRAPIFVGVDSRTKFCLLSMTGRGRDVAEADFAFFLHDPRDIDSVRFRLTPEEITLLNPNTGTLPVFRTRRDAEITLGIYRRVPVLIKEGDPDGNPWGVSFMRMFDMSNDSHLFRSRAELEDDGWTLNGNVFEKITTDGTVARMLPLYEGKMIHHFDHRWATYDSAEEARDVTPAEKSNPRFVVMPRSWVDEAEVDKQLKAEAVRKWYVGFRDITNPTNERTVISALVPRSAVGNKLPLIFTGNPELESLLVANLSSIAFDYPSRNKIGGTTLNFYLLKQLPVLSPLIYAEHSPWSQQETLGDWISSRMIELIQTAIDAPSPYGGARFNFDSERRMGLRAELDCAYFLLYGFNRVDTSYVLDTFTRLRRNEMSRYGEYRTKRLILEVYDAMQYAIDTGTEYQTILDPPPGEGPRHDVAELSMGVSDEPTH